MTALDINIKSVPATPGVRRNPDPTREEVASAAGLVGKRVRVYALPGIAQHRTRGVALTIKACLFDGEKWRLVTDYRTGRGHDWSPTLNIIDYVEVVPEPPVEVVRFSGRRW